MSRGGAAKVVTPENAPDISNASWSKDGKTIYFIGIRRRAQRALHDAGGWRRREGDYFR